MQLAWSSPKARGDPEDFRTLKLVIFKVKNSGSYARLSLGKLELVVSPGLGLATDFPQS